MEITKIIQGILTQATKLKDPNQALEILENYNGNDYGKSVIEKACYRW